MRLVTTRYAADEGWAAPLPADLDSARTLVLAFGRARVRRRSDAVRAARGGVSELVDRRLLDLGRDRRNDGARRQRQRRRRPLRAQRPAPRLHLDLHVADSFAAGARLAAELAGPGLRAVFVLSDGLCVNGTPLVEGLRRHLPEGVVITGGLAGDGSRFARTWILDRAQPEANRICAIGFYGAQLCVGHGCEGGWSDFGPERRITRSSGNVLYELDGKPALALYKTYLGERAQGLPGTALLFPLSVRRAGESGDSLVRTVLAVDEAQQSLTFAGDMPEGAVARLMRANTDKLIGSAGNAARAAAVGVSALDDALVISVSCVGRRLVLGERTEEEVETVQDSAPGRSAHVGFYSYGEISPAVRGGISDLHNQTMTVTVFSEG